MTEFIRKFIDQIKFYNSTEKVEHHDTVELVRGWLAVRDDGEPWPDSMETSRFYPKKTHGDAYWDKLGWVWQEVELKVRKVSDEE